MTVRVEGEKVRYLCGLKIPRDYDPLVEDTELAKKSIVALEQKPRSRNPIPKIITGHAGWADDLDFAFRYKDKVCNSLKKKKTHDPKAPYDGCDETDDMEEKARNVLLGRVNACFVNTVHPQKRIVKCPYYKCNSMTAVENAGCHVKTAARVELAVSVFL